jgi:hypothetical protein
LFFYDFTEDQDNHDLSESVVFPSRLPRVRIQKALRLKGGLGKPSYYYCYYLLTTTSTVPDTLQESGYGMTMVMMGEVE